MIKNTFFRSSLFQYISLLTGGFIAMLFPRLFPFTGLTGVAAFAWIVIFLHLIYQFRSKVFLTVTGVALCIGYSLDFQGVLGIRWLEWVLFIVISGIAYGMFLLYVYLLRKRKNFAVTLILPVLWYLLYFFTRAIRFPTAMRFDMLFAAINPLLQAEALIGGTGLSMSILWIAALVHYGIISEGKRKIPAFSCSAGVLMIVVLLGVINLSSEVTATTTVKVAYTTGPYIGDYINFDTLDYGNYITSMQNSVEKAAQQGAKILVFTEEAFEVSAENEEKFLQSCCDKAKKNNIHLLVGLDVNPPDDDPDGKGQNKIVWISRDGEVIDTYLKRKLIPIMETDYMQGDGVIPNHTVDVDGVKIKIAYCICYDSNFPKYIKQIDRDTDILFLPSWDWDPIWELHTELCHMLSVECGVTVLKSTYDGINVAFTPKGEILCRTSTDEIGFENVQIVEIPIVGQK